MELERYKHMLLLIQQGKIAHIENDDLEKVLAFLIEPPNQKYTIDVLPDGKAFHGTKVLHTLFQERSKRLPQYANL